MSAVRPAREEDTPAIALMLARAFLVDPVAAYLFPDESRRSSRLARFFELQLRHSYLPRGEVLVDEDCLSAALVLGPTSRPPTWRNQLATFEFVWLLGRQITASLELARRMTSAHPPEAHYYLGTLGTDPGAQHQGRASALLASLAARCDEEQKSCCLEASRPENVGLYQRFGFVVHDEVTVRAGAPSIWLMRREPVSSAAGVNSKQW